jgi:hypothetical protein
MPAIHWLPKNIVRLGAIYFYVFFGVEPYWKQLSQYQTWEKAKTYYNYSINKTFYRSIKTIKKFFLTNYFSFYCKTNYKRRGRRDIQGYIFPKSVEVYLEKQ